VNIGAIQSRLYFRVLRFLCARIDFGLQFKQLTIEFKNNSKHRIRDLKEIYDCAEMNAHMGRTLAFFRFLEELELTEKEWNEIYDFI